MIIAQISDTHLDPENPVNDRRIDDLERCIADINGLDPLPDAVIHTGDVVHNGSAEKYALATRILGRLKCPLHVAPGNRDDRRLLRDTFPMGREFMPETGHLIYSVDCYPVRLIAVDTLSGATNMGDFCDARADALVRALDEDTEKPTLLFMHHPPFEVVTSKYRWQFDDQAAIKRLGRAFDGRKNVLRLFCGHAHRLAAGQIAGIPAGSTPSVAVDLRLGDFPTEMTDIPVYQIHRIDARLGAVTSEMRAAQPDAAPTDVAAASD